MREFKPNRLQIVVMLFCVLVMLVGYILVRATPHPIDSAQYRAMLVGGEITRAQMAGNELLFYTKSGIYSMPREAADMRELVSVMPVEVQGESEPVEMAMLLTALAALGMGFYYLRRLSRFRARKNRSDEPIAGREIADEGSFNSHIVPSTSAIKFADVAGIEGAKEELGEIVDFLQNPAAYRKMGVKLPKGVLLVGPPGVGKTMIAKAVAGEANVPFFYQSGASFVQIYVGMGAKRVRELFSVAKASAPSIIFIDEIDAVGKARGGLRNDEREATLNQLLTEMDGFEDNSGVIVVAATNRLEMIDEALLRSGRFDRRVYVSLPDISEREKIISAYLADKKHTVDIAEVARMSVGFSGAALSTLVNEAAINAMKRGSKRVENEDFAAVRDKVLLGKKRLVRYSEEEKAIQATYQAAKALGAYWYEIDFDKISLVGDFTKEIEREIESKTQLLGKIKVALAGSAAQRMNYGETYSNCADDLERARLLASEMVEKYAMGSHLLPLAQDVEGILETSFDEVGVFLEGMKRPLALLAAALLEEEKLTKERIKEILGESFS
jgi:ATP-dependent metalloprotease FtsH